MTDSQKSELMELTNCIVSTVPALKVYLFGSFAYGHPDEESDFDLYVIIPDEIYRSNASDKAGIERFAKASCRSAGGYPEEV